MTSIESRNHNLSGRAIRALRRITAESAKIRAENDPLHRIEVSAPKIDDDIKIKVFRREKPPVQPHLPGTSPLFDFEKGKNI